MSLKPCVLLLALALFPTFAFCQGSDFVQSFTLGGPIVGNSSQTVMGTITVNRSADGGVGPISVGVNTPYPPDCEYGPAGDGCLIPSGANSTTFTMAYAGVVATNTTYNVHTYVDYTQDPGISQTLTIIPASYSMSVSPASALGGSATEPVLTVTRTPAPLNEEAFDVTITSGSGFAPNTVQIQPSGSTQASIPNNYAYATPDVIVYCGTISGGQSCAANTTLTFEPISLTLTLNPSSVLGETSTGTIEQQGTGTVSISGAITTQMDVSFTDPVPIGTTPSLEGIYIPAGSTSATFQFWGSYVTSETSGTITATASTANGYISASQELTVVPAPGSPPMGPCKHCENAGGGPINFTDGNVWIQERDYTLPGLSGGLELKRTWNSLWSASSQISSAGMFGRGWWSTYEERLWVSHNPLEYYGPDGTTWYFGQNPSSGSYFLYSPADEHATLSFSSLTSTYTLVLRDGTQRIFNSAGYLTVIVDRNGNQTSLTYDSSNRITQVADAAGVAITFSYNSQSSPSLATSVQDSVGTIATYTYDSYSRPTRVQYADGSSLNFAYSGWNISSVTDGNGKVLESHTYDSSDRGLTSERADGADNITVSYTSATQTGLTDSLGNTTTYTFENILGQYYMTSIVGSGCASCGGRGNQSMTYDSSANLLSKTDADGNTTNYTYDLSGDVLTKATQLNANTTLTSSYTYNGFGEILTSTDPAGNVTTNTYDANGNLLSTTTPSPGGSGSGSITSFTYDTKGELLTITDPNGNKTTTTYTAQGLLASVDDAMGNTTSYTYDGRGNRLTMKDAANNTTSFTYDSMNRLTTITYPDSSTTSFTYDTRGRRTSVTDENGKKTAYAYDDADRITSVTDAASHVTQYSYDTENNLLSIKDANSHTTSFTYDAYGRVLKTTFPSTLSESYSYDNLGNLLTKTDRNGNMINYTYDALYRLTQKSYPTGTPVSYAYDSLSRLTQVSDASGTYLFTYDNMGRLTGTTTTYSSLPNTPFTNSYTYDAASNRTGYTAPDGSTNTYSYDALNRLTTLANSSAGSFGFSYDALNRVPR